MVSEIEEILKMDIEAYLAKGYEIDVLPPSPERVDLKLRRAMGDFNTTQDGIWELKKEAE